MFVSCQFPDFKCFNLWIYFEILCRILIVHESWFLAKMFLLWFLNLPYVHHNEKSFMEEGWFMWLLFINDFKIVYLSNIYHVNFKKYLFHSFFFWNQAYCKIIELIWTIFDKTLERLQILYKDSFDYSKYSKYWSC